MRCNRCGKESQREIWVCRDRRGGGCWHLCPACRTEVRREEEKIKLLLLLADNTSFEPGNLLIWINEPLSLN